MLQSMVKDAYGDHLATKQLENKYQSLMRKLRL